MAELMLLGQNAFEQLATDGGEKQYRTLRDAILCVFSGTAEQSQELTNELWLLVHSQPDPASLLENTPYLQTMARNLVRKEARENAARKGVRNHRRAAHLRSAVAEENGEYVVIDQRAVQPSEIIEVRIDTECLTDMVRDTLPPAERVVFDHDVRQSRFGDRNPSAF